MDLLNLKATRLQNLLRKNLMDKKYQELQSI